MNTRVYWKAPAFGRIEEWPEILDSAAFFPGYDTADVTLTERVVIKLNIFASEEAWACALSRQANALTKSFLARGYRLLGLARMDVSDQVRPVFVALLKEEKPL